MTITVGPPKDTGPAGAHSDLYRSIANADVRRRPDDEPPTGHVIMCGLRGIGVRIAEQLHRAGETVVVLGEYLDRSQSAAVGGWGMTVVPSAGGTAETLAAAGLGRAKAVVCVIENDLKNLEIALLVRQERPDIRIVTQLGNLAIGRAMRADGGPGAVLDVAALAAPALVEACLSRDIHEVAVEQESFQIATLSINQPGTLRHTFGDLSPIAVVRAQPDGSSEVIACPGRDFAVLPGDRATLQAARLPQSSAVAIMTSSDMANTETALAVRDLIGPRWSAGPVLPVVVRVFDRSLGQTIARRFGFKHVQSTEELTAPWFVGAALGLDVLGSFPVDQQTFMIGRLTVEAGGGLAGLAMDELSENTRVIALNRHATGRLEHPLRRGTRFEPGDLAYLVGPYEELLGVLRRACPDEAPRGVGVPAAY